MSETENETGPLDGERLNETVAMLAHASAAGGFAAFNPAARDGETQASWWYRDGTAEPGTPPWDDFAAAGALGAFATENPGSKGETLFIHARGLQLHALGQWPDQPERVRVAYELFAGVGDVVNRVLSAMRERQAAAESRASVAFDAQSSERIGETVDGLGDREETAAPPPRPRRSRTAEERAAAKAAKSAEKTEGAAAEAGATEAAAPEAGTEAAAGESGEGEPAPSGEAAQS